MKTNHLKALALALLFCISFSFKTKTISIQTSAICTDCKNRIETAVKKINGVLATRLDMNTKKLKVKLDDSITNAEEIRRVISETGYKADQVNPVKSAYQNLPDCCKKPGICIN